MLTLVERQPRITPASWNKVMRLCRQAHEPPARRYRAHARGANGGMLEVVLVVPVIEIFALIARASTMLNFSDGAADVL
jgi:hypothetical protein